jgi:hypothetical protein
MWFDECRARRLECRQIDVELRRKRLDAKRANDVDEFAPVTEHVPNRIDRLMQNSQLCPCIFKRTMTEYS